MANPHAFARTGEFSADLALEAQDLPVLEQSLDGMERERAADSRSGLIADSPRKLRRIHQYFSALCGRAAFPRVRCNVFEYSAVIGATGRVSPRFFIPGPPREVSQDDLMHALNSAPMRSLRAAIRSGKRPECARCVCSLWREPEARDVSDFLMRRCADA